MNFTYQEFVDCYKESLGIEGAEYLIRQTLHKLGLAGQKEFSKAEALKICRQLKKHTGFIGIIGSILQSKITIH